MKSSPRSSLYNHTNAFVNLNIQNQSGEMVLASLQPLSLFPGKSSLLNRIAFDFNCVKQKDTLHVLESAISSRLSFNILLLQLILWS